jgi:hypothetical protein
MSSLRILPDELCISVITSRPTGVPFPVTVVILLFVTASALTHLIKISRNFPYEDQSVISVKGNYLFSLWGSCKVDKYCVEAMHVSFSAEVAYVRVVIIVR